MPVSSSRRLGVNQYGSTMTVPRFTMGSFRSGFYNTDLGNRGRRQGQRQSRQRTLNERRGMLRYIPNSNSNSNSNSNNNNKNKNKNNIKNKNVMAWFNNEMYPGKKNMIPASKRVYLESNIGSNGKVKHVYNKRALKIIKSVAKKSGKTPQSPITRFPFTKKDIKKYHSK